MSSPTQLDQPLLVAADLEGVFLPEIWIAVAERANLPELRLTTRDVPDYDQLMHYRIDILARERMTLADIQSVIAAMEPLAGAVKFLDWLRCYAQIVVITDSFYEFVTPFLAKLHYPTVFAHRLLMDDGGMLTGYRLRTSDGKRKAAAAFKQLGFFTVAVGDSYNDTLMLAEADRGILYCPPDNVIAQFPQFPVTTDYTQLRTALEQFITR